VSVDLTLSKTLGGSMIADTLAGGSAGLDLGSVVNGEYAPIISKTSNTGWQSLYIRHNATVDPITSVKSYVAAYSGTYGGAGANAAADFATLKAKGLASGASANNADGLSSGLRIEMDADLGGTLGLSAFEGSRAQVKIYGDGSGSSTDGIDLASAFDLHVDALVYNNAGTAVDATTPVTGKIGKSGDTVLGDVALVKLRYYLESAAPDGGVLQYDHVWAYTFTA
jgi:hypothetical protein